MTIKKMMTEKAIAANRENAQKSTGPRDTTAVVQNARTHGLLSKNLHFKSEEEKQKFETLLQELGADYKPQTAMEGILVEEIGVDLHKLEVTYEWESAEVEHRRRSGEAMIKSVSDASAARRLFLFGSFSSISSPAHQGWDCQELTVRNNNSDAEQEKTMGGRNSEAGHLQIEAKLTSSLDTILRYQAAIKRDLYRALEALRALKRDREGK